MAGNKVSLSVFRCRDNSAYKMNGIEKKGKKRSRYVHMNKKSKYKLE